MAVSTVEQERGALMGVAYRMLGSITEAEDAVQEAYARWYALTQDERDSIASPGGWLVRVTSRVCLDVLGTARVRREHYVGQWLPEPVPAAARWTSQSTSLGSTDPADRVSLDESLSMAMLVVLETMTPAERVAFVLHDVFGYSFAEIGEVVGRSSAACRQLASSARRRLRASRAAPVSPEEHARVVDEFRSALETGDPAALVRTLDPDAAAVPDGGGRVQAAIEPILGARAIADYLVALVDAMPALRFRSTTVNGRAGLSVEDGQNSILAVMSFAVAHGVVERLWVVRNPGKLTRWS